MNRHLLIVTWTLLCTCLASPDVSIKWLFFWLQITKKWKFLWSLEQQIWCKPTKKSVRFVKTLVHFVKWVEFKHTMYDVRLYVNLFACVCACTHFFCFVFKIPIFRIFFVSFQLTWFSNNFLSFLRYFFVSYRSLVTYCWSLFMPSLHVLYARMKVLRDFCEINLSFF